MRSKTVVSTTAVALLLALSNVVTTRALSYAALGDSYAAGDGAGSSRLLPHFDIGCGRFSGAYPVQVANSTDLNIPDDRRHFKNLACGGTTSTSVLYSQVSQIGDSDIVTITVGGNEVDFFVVLNACIHQFWPSPPGSCEKEMLKARTLIQSSAFLDSFNRMVAVTKKKMKPDALLLITGYAAFFNDKSEQCNNVSFSKRNPGNVLTQELRASFNKLLIMVNNVIEAAADAHGAKYINIDAMFEGHRFCEEGVIEPSQREATWFFNMNMTRDDASRVAEASDERQHTLPEPIKDFFDLTKTFHPTSRGHAAIAKEIVHLVQSELPS
jgi:lysophospholipase L1-like esterase